jgi:hypothetical protein
VLAQRSEFIPEGAPLRNEIHERFIVGRRERLGQPIDRRLERGLVRRGSANGGANGSALATIFRSASSVISY